VSLEASYFATVYRLNAFLAFDKNRRINPFAPDGLRRMSVVKEQKSYPEAKRLLSLLPIAPHGDVALYWSQHQALLAALVTALSHHVNNPDEPPATKDELRCYDGLIRDLGITVILRRAGQFAWICLSGSRLVCACSCCKSPQSVSAKLRHCFRKVDGCT
jgi:hypothetical protein